MTSVPEQPTSRDTLQDEEAVRRVSLPLDPREVLPPADAERLIDAMARILVAAARVRAERTALGSER